MVYRYLLQWLSLPHVLLLFKRTYKEIFLQKNVVLLVLAHKLSITNELRHLPEYTKQTLEQSSSND